MSVIAVLGNFSGRNAGDAAILGNLLDDIAAVYPDATFLIPTLNTQFVNQQFGHHRIEACGLMPWNGALKIFGLPTLRAMLKADLVLVTDNLLFDRDLLNPLFNYLSTIALFAPLCRQQGIPIVLYNASLGPITTGLGRRALQWVLNACPLAILRDRQSLELLKTQNFTYPETRLNADCAINTVPPSEERMAEIIEREGLFANPHGTLGFNINSYINSWNPANQGDAFGRPEFVRAIATTLDRLIESLDVDIMYTITQVMDTQITEETLQQVRHRNRIRVVSNASYTYREIAGLLQRVGLHVGMRTHSIILAAAVGTPVFGINSYPKTAGFLATIGQQDWSIELADLTGDRLISSIERAWATRQTTRAALRPEVRREQAKARGSVELLAPLLNPSLVPSAQLRRASAS